MQIRFRTTRLKGLPGLSGEKTLSAAASCASLLLTSGHGTVRSATSLLVLLFLTCLTFAQTQVFRPTGSLNTTRSGHTATLLLDGTVLVTGGPAPSEIYDPVTEKWTETGETLQRRNGHTATRLLDGRVLVVGAGTADESAEIYNPQTRTWSATGSLNVGPRFSHTATLLNDGSVLVVGGYIQAEGEKAQTPAAELWDPQSESWALVGELATTRELHAATLLQDGRVLIAGGKHAEFTPPTHFLDSVEIYDPVAKSFTPAPALARHRGYHTATLLDDGRVLIVAGWDDIGGSLTATEIYDSEVGSQPGPELLIARNPGHTATRFPDGRVLIMGRYPEALYVLAGGIPPVSSEVYDPGSGRFFLYARGGVRRNHTATLLLNGSVLIAGGVRAAGFGGEATCELLVNDPKLFYPHVALGGGFRTILMVTNQGQEELDVYALLEDGNWPDDWPWSVNGKDETGRSSFSVSIDPDETRKFVLESSSGAFTGSLTLRIYDSGDLVYGDVASSLFYEYLDGATLQDMISVPAAFPSTASRFAVELGETVNTGIALREASGLVTYTLFDQDGTLLQQVSLEPEEAEVARFFDQIFEGVSAPFLGSVRVESASGFYLLVLRQQMSGDSFQLTTIATSDAP